MRTALRIACVLAVVATAVATPAAGSPQPTPTCRFCGFAFERAADDLGVAVDVEASTADVRIHENGSATWTVRNTLASAGAFRDDSGQLDAVAGRLAERGHGPPDDPVLVDAHRDGDVAVLVFRDPDAAERRAGLLVVDYFHDGGYEPWYHVNADRLSVHGPEGRAVTNDPTGVAVEDGTATWRGNGSAELYRGTTLEGSPYLVFADRHSAATELRTTAALALATLPVVADSAEAYLLPQTLAFALALAGVVAVVRGRRVPLAPETTATVLAAAGALAAVVPVAVHGVGWLFGPPLFALGFGVLVVAGGDAVDRRLAAARGRVAVGASLLAVTYLVTVVAGTAGAAWDRPLVAAARSTAFALPFAAFVPLGGVLDDAVERLLPWAVAAVVAFAVVPPTFVDFADPPTGFGSGIVGILLFLAAVAAPVLGVPFLALGRSFGDSNGS
jgi:hypothetical protein